MVFETVLQQVLLKLDQVLKNQELLLARTQIVVDPADCILDIPTSIQTMAELDELCIRLDDANFRKTMVSLYTFYNYYYYSILHIRIIEDI